MPSKCWLNHNTRKIIKFLSTVCYMKSVLSTHINTATHTCKASQEIYQCIHKSCALIRYYLIGKVSCKINYSQVLLCLFEVVNKYKLRNEIKTTKRVVLNTKGYTQYITFLMHVYPPKLLPIHFTYTIKPSAVFQLQTRNCTEFRHSNWLLRDIIKDKIESTLCSKTFP